jgi:hypothetical protein
LLIFGELDALVAFAVSYMLVIWVIAVVEMAGTAKLLRYGFEHDRIRFVATRSTAYASVSALTHVAVSRGLPPRVGNLVWLLLATTESVIMFTIRSGSYAFSVRSTSFAVYALIKSALFVTSPLIQSAVLERYGFD